MGKISLPRINLGYFFVTGSIYLFHTIFSLLSFYSIRNFTWKKGSGRSSHLRIEKSCCNGQLNTDGRNLRREEGQGKNNKRAVRPRLLHSATRTCWNRSWAEIRSVVRAARFKFNTSVPTPPPKIRRRYLLLPFFFPRIPADINFLTMDRFS